jgi:hypothetical protein
VESYKGMIMSAAWYEINTEKLLILRYHDINVEVVEDFIENFQRIFYPSNSTQKKLY